MADSIFAQATPPGRSGLAVIRISGPDAVAAAARLGAGRLTPRRAALRRLRDPGDRRLIDTALALRFDAPASFTGEDVVELQLHGSVAVCRAVAAALGRLPGLRPAEPGEFTRRALMNGKLDLVQAEGLGDLLAAETAAQAKQALALMEGKLSSLAQRWRDDLVRALALIEATIDFAEEDLPDVLAEARAILARVTESFETELRGGAAHERVREGFEVALVGAPNVGKSTLLNALAGREAAITSAIAGTTRDAVELRMDLDGLPVTVVDMAGIRESPDAVEALGVARARDRAARADLRVFLLETPDAPADLGVAAQPGDLLAQAKADIFAGAAGLAVSGLSGEGVGALLARIAAELSSRASSASMIGHERQRVAVGRALKAVRACEDHIGGLGEVELAAAELRDALRALDFLLGRVDVEAVLDVIFRNFCIGK